jgi:hypothetical protein
MPTTVYDSSLITQRRRATAISGSFISRISPWNNTPPRQIYIETPQNQPNTGYAPRLGIYDQSIINTVINGQMAEYRKGEGCTTVDYGCPCKGLGVGIESESTIIPIELSWRILPPNDIQSSDIYAMAFDSLNGILYIGGFFTTINGGTTVVNNIVKWDGVSLSAIVDINGYNGLNDSVRALTVTSGGILYIGGDFQFIIGPNPLPDINAYNIAQYNISTNEFQTLGEQDGITYGFNSPVHTILENPGNGMIYIGGEFATNGDGSNTYNHIVVYDPLSPTLSPLIDSNTSVIGTNDTVFSITAYVNNPTIYIGGSFTLAGGVSDTEHIASWKSDNTWNPVDKGLDSTVYTLLLIENKLYIGGSFTTPIDSGLTTNLIVMFDIDTETWSSVGTGTEFISGSVQNIRSLAIYNDILYVSGNFTSPTNGIAQWNGSSWSSVNGSLFTLDLSLGQGIFSLATGTINNYNYIYAGGQFGPLTQGPGTGIGNPVVPANHIAYYGPI